MPDDYSWVANISPYVATVVATAAVVLGFLKFKQVKFESKAKTAAQSQLDAIQQSTGGTDTKITVIVRQVTSLDTKLDTHIVNEDRSRDEATSVLREIHKQLVSLNAGLTGSVINQDNAKLIIGYQWAWCRDETIRVLVRSITDNHFRGNETVVARNVYRGWNKAAKDALASLHKLNGIKYPYNPMFIRHLDYAYACAWNWAIPLYHDKRTNTFEVKLLDLSARVSALFDLIHDQHVDAAEDVASGALYSEDHPVDMFVTFDESLATRMGEQLRTYASDEETNRMSNPTPAAVRLAIKANLDDMYRRKAS